MISGRQLAVTPPTPPAPSPARTNSPRMINDVAGSDWTPLVIFKLWRISGCLPPLLSPGQNLAHNLQQPVSPITVVRPGWVWPGRPILQIKTSGWLARDGQYSGLALDQGTVRGEVCRL